MSGTLLKAMAVNRSLFNQTVGYGTEGEVFRHEHVKWSYTGYSLSNYVFDLHFQEESVQDEVEAVLRTFQTKQASTTWIIDPFCTPATITTVLDRYPRSDKGEFTAMALRMSDFSEHRQPPEDFSIQEATSQADLEVWGKVVCDGFGIGGAQAHEYQRLCVNAALASGPDFTFRQFVGFRAGKPICATSLLLDGAMAGIYWVTTIPEARRQKAALTLLSHVLTLAQTQGYEWSVLQATPMGANVYTILGFREYYRETYFDGVTLP
ncbi:GNAT family N-acetyltransferase [Tengunoibacter tsumagoiensis]|uniref:N-acetyltransferase domain-containing protein n=1 Tax=Tengunoibacter tsumagoiensis TaxID=2014871 RepID=A0A402A9H5_9CHLR|nr:GNAT family N-acetyltransferase [Tengunoibacter tsumagoiensis]GCE15748.1 hypothetical protein KTT_56070 [Tengunoibacter tsumagoiensis]